MLPPRWANYGCGPDWMRDTAEKRWINFDSRMDWAGYRTLNSTDQFKLWDMTKAPEDQWVEWFHGGVLNHVLCTMNDYNAHQVLINIHRTLKPGAKLTVIEMDLLKVFKSYEEGRVNDIPISEGTIDDRFCFAISGYGTRNSVYTPARMEKVLTEAGFRVIIRKEESEYDTRPKESLIFEATK